MVLTSAALFGRLDSLVYHFSRRSSCGVMSGRRFGAELECGEVPRWSTMRERCVYHSPSQVESSQAKSRTMVQTIPNAVFAGARGLLIMRPRATEAER